MPRVVIVKRRTRLASELHRLGGSLSSFRFTVDNSAEIEAEDERYEGSLTQVVAQIPRETERTFVDRDDISTFAFRPSDIVVTVGPDGLFANVARFLSDQPIITVNPDPRTVPGVLALHAPETVGVLLAALASGTLQYDRIPLARAVSDQGDELFSVNDFFIGRSDPGTADYTLICDGIEERHFSSGVIVSTGVGSTGWIRSVSIMVQAMSGHGRSRFDTNLPRTAPKLLFAIREPMGRYGHLFGQVEANQNIELVSNMTEKGVVVCDGILERPMLFTSGTRVMIMPAARFVRLATGIKSKVH